jgi:hypothetical protein
VNIFIHVGDPSPSACAEPEILLDQAVPDMRRKGPARRWRLDGEYLYSHQLY